ncbi:UvrD/REP helicase N-terminal domain-containing protein [Natrinema hispanicum]|uniref:UvrD/REP helicase N-terminal domain-containing protein n=1 Tax=Natrinema hispanicum TaxID=392421 RepID=A0A482YC54_9EURY|nr:UvrD-helicase domain-containing protein [Natrinema hispanicum]RZV10470.1 UvrD/REP helicase N-terminal domain-containing protein [Natrinema hispanicum]
MNRVLAFIRGLFSSSSTTGSLDPEVVLQGTDRETGVIETTNKLIKWKKQYTEEYTDYLTIYEALNKYETASEALARLEPLLDESGSYEEQVLDAAKTLEEDLQAVLEFIERRSTYNAAWIDHMKKKHGSELNDFFDDPDHTHTHQQFRAIFANDNFNRVNAAAGTGKTTTFGRRVHFILSEFDDVAASDLLAFTFTRNGRDEMQKELEETFDITGVDVRTINSYSKSIAEKQYSDLEFIVGEAKTTEIARIWRDIQDDEELEATYESFMSTWKDDRYDPNDIDVVDGVYESHAAKSTVTIQGEEVQLDAIPEEGIAHKSIAQLLTTLGLEYDYQTHIEWASSPSDGSILDFELVEPVQGERLYIQYCTSEETREDRPQYRNIHSERPETIRRLFTSNPKLENDPEGKTVIVLDGENLLDRPSDDLNWKRKQTKVRFANAVQTTLENELQQVGIDLSNRLSGRDLKDYVYDRKVLYHDIRYFPTGVRAGAKALVS